MRKHSQAADRRIVRFLYDLENTVEQYRTSVLNNINNTNCKVSYVKPDSLHLDIITIVRPKQEKPRSTGTNGTVYMREIGKTVNRYDGNSETLPVVFSPREKNLLIGG
jgi:hypothetical protein